VSDLDALGGVPLRPQLEPGVPAAMRRLARLATSDVQYDRGCAGGRWHGAVDATVGSSVKTFDAHQAQTLAALLEALADAVEAERRGLRP
jgi:hypothetical protein